MNLLFRVCPIFLIGFACAVEGRASLLFDISYSSAVTSDPNYASIQTAINFVANEFSGLYSDNITINIGIDESSSISLGQSSTSLMLTSGYAQLLAALAADSTSAADQSFVGSLPATNPTGNQWWLATAEAKALGLLAGNFAASDGTYTFNPSYTYTYDPNNRSVPGAFDFIGVTEHEFSEIMGRIPGLGQNIGGGAANLPFDLARFTAAGVRSYANPGSGVYFSVDNGTTNLAGFNSGGGDPQDFNGAVATDPFNASTGAGQGHALTSADIQVLDVLGYDLAAPEPGTFGMVGGVLIGAALLRKKLIRG
jgi:hypothetical protein